MVHCDTLSFGLLVSSLIVRIIKSYDDVERETELPWSDETQMSRSIYSSHLSLSLPVTWYRAVSGVHFIYFSSSSPSPSPSRFWLIKVYPLSDEWTKHRPHWSAHKRINAHWTHSERHKVPRVSDATGPTTGTIKTVWTSVSVNEIHLLLYVHTVNLPIETSSWYRQSSEPTIFTHSLTTHTCERALTVFSSSWVTWAAHNYKSCKLITLSDHRVHTDGWRQTYARAHTVICQVKSQLITLNECTRTQRGVMSVLDSCVFIFQVIFCAQEKRKKSKAPVISHCVCIYIYIYMYMHIDVLLLHRNGIISYKWRKCNDASEITMDKLHSCEVVYFDKFSYYS